MKKFLIGILSVIVALVIFMQFYALQPVPIPEKSEFLFDLGKIRLVAKSQQGSKPIRINSMLICKGEIPKLFVVAGQGFKLHSLFIYSYQIVYPNKTIIIDTAIDKESQSEKMSRATFYQENYDIMQTAIRKASVITLTHEHLDHCAGLFKSPYLQEVATRIVLTDEQLNSPHIEASGFTAEIKNLITPLTYDKTHLLAPGIVLIKAPGHTPGSQMIYVLLEDGTEFLLVGDIAWHMDNIVLPRAHPRVINWALKEDALAQVHQLKFLHDFHREHPAINIVVAHDGRQMDNYIQDGLIHEGFSIS